MKLVPTPTVFVQTCPSSKNVGEAYKADDSTYDIAEPSLLGTERKTPAWSLDEAAFKAYVSANCSDHTLTEADVKAYGALSDTLTVDNVDSDAAGSKICSSRLLGPECALDNLTQSPGQAWQGCSFVPKVT